jgi:hypothetical protein
VSSAISAIHFVLFIHSPLLQSNGTGLPRVG